MGSSITLFRAFGIDVRVHWSFLLILAYGAFAYGGGSGGPLIGALFGMLFIVLLFVCVTLHEFGHALVAKYFGVNVAHITLLPIGGVASLERMPDKPLQEFLITIAGPLVNFAIALLLLPFVIFTTAFSLNSGQMIWEQLLTSTIRYIQNPGIGSLIMVLFATNLTLGIFNLLPAFPMDGGRILRSLLAMTLPYVQATRIAVIVGRMLAVGMAFIGIFGGGIIFLLIAFFVYVGGGAELEGVESRAVLRHVPVRQALTSTAANLYSSERISRAVDLLMDSYQTDYPVLDLSGKFIGVLTRPRLIQALRESGPDTRIVDVMIKAEDVPVVSPTANLADVWEKIAQNGTRVVAVKQANDFLGLLTLDDITEVFHIVGATMSRTGRPPSNVQSFSAPTRVVNPDPAQEAPPPADA
jgi:Zn-dependent protease/predicted transcriptional regulator